MLIGSYIQFVCADGFSNSDGNLQVSCKSDGQWSSFPICVSQNGAQTSGRCSWENDPLPSVFNAYRSNAENLRVFSNGQASGYYDIECNPGYALDASIGSRITCLESGQWSSPLPRCNCMSQSRTLSVKDTSSLFLCLAMGSCPIESLFEFLRTTEGVEPDRSKSYLYTNGIDDDHALGGSNITVQCREGFTQVGGGLTIICTIANTWTPFPQCLPITTVTSSTVATPSQATTTLTVAPEFLRCPYTDETLKFPNGRLADTKNLALYSDMTAKGSLLIECLPGSVMDTISGGLFSCNDGLWSSRPSCSSESRLSDSIQFDRIPF